MLALGIDYGKVRIGLAAHSAGSTIAFPLEVIKHRSFDDRFSTVLSEREINRIYVGLPLQMDGELGPAAQEVLKWARAKQKMFSSIEWRVIDERLTTVGISKNLSDQGISTKDQKAFIDAAAACEILNGALVSEEKLGLRVGQLIENI